MKGQLPHVAHEVKILTVCEKEWELRIPEGEFGEARGEHRSKQLISNTPCPYTIVVQMSYFFMKQDKISQLR